MDFEHEMLAHEIAPNLLHLLRSSEAFLYTFGGPGRLGISVELICFRVGRAFHPTPLPPTVPRGLPKRCFETAANLALRNPGLTYAEGVALDPAIPLPIHHAWAVDAEGRVVDPTWRHPERCEYIGVPFTRAQLNDELRRTGVHGMFDAGSGFNWRVIDMVDPMLARECRAGCAA